MIGGILIVILYWMGDLMDNTFILDGAMGMKLQAVWMVVRNLVNIFFAILLLGVAFANVIGYGGGEGNYSVKKFLPKLALALIAVNFTFLAAKVVLDVNNVLTTAVFAIPQNIVTMSQLEPAGGEFPLKLYKKYTCTLDSNRLKKLKDKLPDTSIPSAKDITPAVPGSPVSVTTQDLSDGVTGVTVLGAAGGDYSYEVPKKEGLKTLGFCVATVDSVNSGDFIDLSQPYAFNKKNFVWLMALRFQNIQLLNKLPDMVNNFDAVMVNAGFSIFFAIIYAIAYVVLFIVLLARIAVLWVCIMLSPLVAIEIAFPSFKSIMGEKMDIKNMFLKHAFVPLKIAVPMAIGFVMLSQMQLVASGASLFKEFKVNFETGGEFVRGGTFAQILYSLASAAVIWMGVFSAAEGVMGVDSVIKGIKSGAESVGKTVAKLPTYARVIPVGKGKATTFAGLMRTPKAFVSHLQQQFETNETRNLMSSLGIGAAGESRTAVTTALANFKNESNDANRAALRTALEQHWSKLDSGAKEELAMELGKMKDKNLVASVFTGRPADQSGEFVSSHIADTTMKSLEGGSIEEISRLWEKRTRADSADKRLKGVSEGDVEHHLTTKFGREGPLKVEGIKGLTANTVADTDTVLAYIGKDKDKLGEVIKKVKTNKKSKKAFAEIFISLNLTKNLAKIIADANEKRRKELLGDLGIEDKKTQEKIFAKAYEIHIGHRLGEGKEKKKK